MSDIPVELSLQILLNSNIDTILSLCKINKKYRNICTSNENYLCRSLFKKYLSIIALPDDIKITLISFKQFYDSITTNQFIRDYLQINKGDSDNVILKKLSELNKGILKYLSLLDDFDLKYIDKTTIKIYSHNMNLCILRNTTNISYETEYLFKKTPKKIIMYILEFFIENYNGECEMFPFNNQLIVDILFNMIKYNFDEKDILFVINYMIKHDMTFINNDYDAMYHSSSDYVIDSVDYDILYNIIRHQFLNILMVLVPYLKSKNEYDRYNTMEGLLEDLEESDDKKDKKILKFINELN